MRIFSFKQLFDSRETHSYRIFTRGNSPRILLGFAPPPTQRFISLEIYITKQGFCPLQVILLAGFAPPGHFLQLCTCFSSFSPVIEMVMHLLIGIAISTCTISVHLYPCFSLNSCYNPKIEGNAEQLTAVKNIVAGSSGSCPYIIFGPPGTGKTVTCVEAMKQVCPKEYFLL